MSAVTSRILKFEEYVNTKNRDILRTKHFSFTWKKLVDHELKVDLSQKQFSGEGNL